ncbi:hypothetical protein DIPPA_28528, partial [Diplonema papillatum]
DWYADLKYPGLRSATLPAEQLLPMPVSAENGELTISVTELARHVGYRELYTMARLRRMQEKLAQWKAAGASEAEIRMKLLDDDADDGTVMSPTLITASVQSRRSEMGEEDASRTITMRQQQPEAATREQLVREEARMPVLEDCGLCHEDFAVTFCPHHDLLLCETCDALLHQHGEDRKHTRVKPHARTSPLAEIGYVAPTNLWDVYTATTIIAMFLCYPSMMRELAQMLNCTDEICTALGTCRRYLKEDPRIDCSSGRYSTFWTLSLAFLLVYGIGIPLGAFVLLRRQQMVLSTKRALKRYGFLYAGYRRSKYCWELVVTGRRLLLAVLLVGLADHPRYQMYAATWVVTLCIFLNIFMKPFQHAFLWRLENCSLISLLVTFNIALLFLEDLSPSAESALSLSVLIVNISVLAGFGLCILRELRRSIRADMDLNEDGALSCNEVTVWFTSWWTSHKPESMRTARERVAGKKELELRRKWRRVDDLHRRDMRLPAAAPEAGLGPLAEFGYWLEYYTGRDKRRDRLEWLADVSEQAGPKKRSGYKAGLSADQVQQYCNYAIGELIHPVPVAESVNM